MVLLQASQIKTGILYLDVEDSCFLQFILIAWKLIGHI